MNKNTDNILQDLEETVYIQRFSIQELSKMTAVLQKERNQLEELLKKQCSYKYENRCMLIEEECNACKHIWRADINKDTHVYCTHCKWFRIDEEEVPYCYWETRCSIEDPEDSMRFEDRPCYEERII